MTRQPSIAKELLGELKIEPRPERIKIVDVLLQADQPLTADEILAKLPKSADLRAAKSALTLLLKKGLMQKAKGRGKVERYVLAEFEEEEHDHSHFVCDACGWLGCIENLEVPADLQSGLKLPRGYLFHHTEIMVHGLCPTCRKRFVK